MQSIKRKRAGDNFTIINNDFLRDENLSLKAKGLLSYILSLPDDWKIYFEEVSRHQVDSEGIVKKAWRELEKNGYARTTRLIDSNTKKVKEWFKEVSDFKNPDWEKPQGGKATSGKTTKWENHIVENDPLLNTNIQSTDKPKTDITKTTTTTTAGFENLAEIYQKNFGMLQPILAEMLREDIDDFGYELVLEAMKRAIASQKTYRYAQGILKSWDVKNIKTVEQAQSEDVSLKNAARNKTFGKIVKPAPAWSQQKSEPDYVSEEELKEWLNGN